VNIIKSQHDGTARLSRALCAHGQHTDGQLSLMHGRPYIGANGVSLPHLPLEKMDKKLKSENMQKEQLSEWGWG